MTTGTHSGATASHGSTVRGFGVQASTQMETTMPSSKHFRVTFIPAKRDGAFIVSSFTMMGEDLPRYDIFHETLDALMADVERLGKLQEQGVSASIRCMEKRKPNGFDKRTKRLYYNLEDKVTA